MQHNNNNDGIYSILGVVMVSFNLVIPPVVVLAEVAGVIIVTFLHPITENVTTSAIINTARIMLVYFIFICCPNILYYLFIKMTKRFVFII